METALESADRETLLARIVQLETRLSSALARNAEPGTKLAAFQVSGKRPP